MVAEPVIVVDAAPMWSLRNGSQLYVVDTVTLTGSPTRDVPLGKLMQTCAASGTDPVPPERSSSVVACCWMYVCSVPAPGFLSTTAQRAASFARCVSSIQ